MKLIVISIGVLFLLSTVTAVIIQIIQKNSSETSKTESLGKDFSNKVKTSDDPGKDLYTNWSWVSSVNASDETITPKDSSKFILTFSQDGKISSTTDCNQVGGSFVKNEEVLSVGPLMSTLMACERETLEAVYTSQLALVTSYEIKDNTLTLNLLKDGGTMKFIKK